jgi:hypothetical protein
MKVKKCTPNYIIYGELGRVPMSVHINARMIGFWARIVNGILYQLNFCDVYHSKWLNCVKDILNKCGFINCWNDQLVPRNYHITRLVQPLHRIIVTIYQLVKTIFLLFVIHRTWLF